MMNNRKTRGVGRFASRIASAAMGAAMLLTATAPHAGAQSKEPTVRLIQGTVTDKADKPIANAVVYLKDEKTLQVKSYLTDEAGHFRFGQLSMSTDYDIWAEHSGSKSKTKSLSNFNSKSTVEYALKVE